MNLIHLYRKAEERFEECLRGEKNPMPDQGDVMWLMGLGDHYCEMEIIEDLMLDAMEGLS